MGLLQEAFHEGDTDHSGEISWREFLLEMNGPRFKGCLQELGVEVEDLKNLFSLLDVDGSGSVGEAELVKGSLRLMGDAKALDLALLMNYQRSNAEEWAAHARQVESYLLELLNAGSKLPRGSPTRSVWLES